MTDGLVAMSQRELVIEFRVDPGAAFAEIDGFRAKVFSRLPPGMTVAFIPMGHRVATVFGRFPRTDGEPVLVR